MSFHFTLNWTNRNRLTPGSHYNVSADEIQIRENQVSWIEFQRMKYTTWVGSKNDTKIGCFYKRKIERCQYFYYLYLITRTHLYTVRRNEIVIGKDDMKLKFVQNNDQQHMIICIQWLSLNLYERFRFCKQGFT